MMTKKIVYLLQIYCPPAEQFTFDVLRIINHQVMAFNHITENASFNVSCFFAEASCLLLDKAE